MSAGVVVVGPHGPIVTQLIAPPPEPLPPPEPMEPIEQVVLVPDYLPDRLDDIVNALDESIATINPSAVAAGPGVDINHARRTFVTFLRSAAFTLNSAELFGEPGIAASLKARELDDVLARVGVLARSTATTAVIGIATMERALTQSPADYTIDFPVGPPIPQTLPGYGGPALDHTQLTALEAFSWFMSLPAERSFRLTLLRAEASAGLREYGDAIASYEALLSSSTVSDPKKRFVALRAGFARIAEGDRLYRSSRAPSSNLRASITTQYDAAIAVVTGRGIGDAHPVRRQIVDAAVERLAMVAARLNALGLRDSYVPSLQPETLEERARTRIARAVDARDRFVTFRERANSLDDQAAELALESDVAAINVELAEERRSLAGQQTGLAEARKDQIEEQIDGLLANAVLSAGTGIISAMASAKGINPFLAVADGIGSAAIGYHARSGQLGDQLELAKLEVAIGEREERIVALEEDIAQVRAASLRDRIETLGNRLLDADLCYELSNLYEAMAERNLEMAVRWTFLYERAVAFRRLIPDLRAMPTLDPRAGATGRIAAPELLTDVVDAIADAELPVGEYQLLNENPLSLRTKFPIEFSRFLQTGQMDFTISLYDLEKLRPGVYHRRLERVVVEVTGNIPIPGFGGTIRHRGAFAIRDKVTTLGPPPTDRLLPDAAAIAAAVRDGAATMQGVPVEGVLYFLLDEAEDIQQLSAAPPPDDNNPEARAFAIFEGRGETGNWHLEITGPQFDLRNVTDVLIRFTAYFPETDKALESHVEELVSRYEQDVTGDALDRIVLVSLREQFPDALDALRSGPASFPITAEDLPSGSTDERVKAVVAQFVDVEGVAIAGLTIEMARPDTPFAITRTSGEDGLTEPPDVPIEVVQPPEDRVPVVGSWRLRLVDPSGVDRIDDVRLFVIYSFLPPA